MASNRGTRVKVAELSQLAANPSGDVSAGLWCEALNDALGVVDAWWPFVQHRSTCILMISRSPLREASWCDCGLREVVDGI